MTISENWMLNECYRNTKEILRILQNLESVALEKEENSEKPGKTGADGEKNTLKSLEAESV